MELLRFELITYNFKDTKMSGNPEQFSVSWHLQKQNSKQRHEILKNINNRKKIDQNW